MRPHIIIIIFITVITVIFPHPALANTDPQSATVSATATIQSTTPTTSDTTSPTKPILIRPVDGTITSDLHPEFVWTQSTDPNGNVVIYTLYLNNVATFLGISNQGNSSGVGYTARIESSSLRLLPNADLSYGSYDWYIAASDLSGNTSYSTTWHLVISPPLTPLTIPPSGRSPLPYTLDNLPELNPLFTYLPPLIRSLPSQIAELSSRRSLSFYYYLLLAVAISILMVLIWYRPPNILILDQKTGQPYRSLILYHSVPRTNLTQADRPKILVTNHPPILYKVPSTGLLYIPRLGRYSTMTIRADDLTHILSISVSARFYTLVV